MSRLLAALAALWLIAGAGAAAAQNFSGLARIDAANSRISETGRDGVQIDLFLSQGVPYRLFTLTEPPRLVLDFQEVDWTGLDPDFLLATQRLQRVRFGTYVPGWSRMVAELAAPMGVRAAGVQLDPVTGAAHLTVQLSPVSAEVFAAQAGAPHDPRWDLPTPAALPAPAVRDADAPLLVVLDPGHGGIDPGAEAGSVNEKSLMLQFARELREQLLRSGGFQVVLTRDSDHFVSLEQRVAIAHRAGADVFLSLHADSLAEGLAHGATVHVLSRDASDKASAKLAERHDRGQLLSGVDLSDTDDQVTGILLDLARQETQPRTEALAQALVEGMAHAGGPMNRRPLRRAAFSVLKAADIPSVLVEIGFLSSPRDLKNLRDPQWRAEMALGIRNGLLAWRQADLAMRPLLRQ
ncbi:N-acetylmuramoyl-L-alanine amidase [Sedimentitalea sp. HM32M-2]|uniref:N-acetylmuramoyl-L-alanine amidase n=1 Tax=Sedimentitalea sp. HM32M-2 TaxID=3351566 RepID=UPI003628AE5D